MKLNTLLIGLSIALMACGSKADKEISSEGKTEIKESNIADDALAVNQQKSEGHYGKMIDEEGVISMNEFDKLISKTDDTLEVKISSTAKEVCVKKGCWMKIDLANGDLMRVTFKDYGFFVPKDAAGKTAIMQGVAKKEEVSVDDLKHLAEDAGQSEAEINAITEPQVELTFVADGVIIK